MKKRIGILLALLALSVNAETQPDVDEASRAGYKHSAESEKMDHAGQDRMGRLLSAALVAVGAEAAGRRLGTASSIVKGSQLGSALYALGTLANDSTYKDLALRVPLALGASKVVGLAQTQALMNKIPLGIGDALRNMGSDASSVEAVALYEMIKPLYGKFRDDTKVGQWLVHGN